eukprot:994266-Rhodomonas_salina.1
MKWLILSSYLDFSFSCESTVPDADELVLPRQACARHNRPRKEQDRRPGTASSLLCASAPPSPTLTLHIVLPGDAQRAADGAEAGSILSSGGLCYAMPGPDMSCTAARRGARE